MSLLTVVQDVCAFVGVERPQSVFANLNSDRTMQEMLACANETANAIAYDEREWTRLYTSIAFTGDGVQQLFLLPADFKRLLLNSNVYRSSMPTIPLTFLSDIDDVLMKKLSGYWYTTTPGYYWITNGDMGFHPVLAGPQPAVAPWKNSTFYAISGEAYDAASNSYWKSSTAHASSPSPVTFAMERSSNPGLWVAIPPKLTPAETANFVYLDKNCISDGATGTRSEFLADDDTFILEERLLKLGMIWRWKQSKGSPYAEDMSNYEVALSRVAGADKPAPIIINRRPLSSYARVGFPWPPDWGSRTL